MDERKLVSGKYLEYKGKPLVREGDTICYGNADDGIVLLLEIFSYTEVNGEKVADDVFITLVNPKDMTKNIKEGSKKGLAAAFDLGVTWYEQAIQGNIK